MLRDQFLLLSMKSNEEDNYILFCERVSSDVLERVTSKKFSGGKPPDPHFTMRSFMAHTFQVIGAGM